MSITVTKAIGHLRSRSAPVSEMGGDQDAVRFRVVMDVARILTAIGETVMRVQLDPMTVNLMVDIVTKGELPTSSPW